ncbi:hypothetical protein [Enterocloster clostridioformis]
MTNTISRIRQKIEDNKDEPFRFYGYRIAVYSRKYQALTGIP